MTQGAPTAHRLNAVGLFAGSVHRRSSFFTSMIVVVGHDPELTSASTEALKGLGNLVVVPGVEWATPFLARAEAVVVVADGDVADAARTIRAIRYSGSATPLFVVLRVANDSVGTAGALEALKAEVIWEDRMEDLRRVAADGIANGALLWLRGEIRSRGAGSTLAGQVAAILCGQPFPPRTVQRLASMVGMSEATLRRRWKAEVAWMPSVRTLLDWSLVFGWLQMAEAHTIGEAAASLRVDRRTIERAVRRVGLGTPRRAAANRPAVLARARQSLGGSPRSELESA